MIAEELLAAGYTRAFMTDNRSSSGTEYVPADLAARIELYLDDAPMYGGHSDKAGGTCWELLREAMEELRTPAPGGQAEVVAWRVYCTNNGATGYIYTETLPFEPGPSVHVRRDPEPLFATSPTQIAGAGTCR